MGHYNIRVTLSKEEVALLKGQFNGYLDKAGAIKISVESLNDVPDPPQEVIMLLKKIFLRVMAQANTGKFEGLN